MVNTTKILAKMGAGERNFGRSSGGGSGAGGPGQGGLVEGGPAQGRALAEEMKKKKNQNLII